jgi:hypothetical protein
MRTLLIAVIILSSVALRANDFAPRPAAKPAAPQSAEELLGLPVPNAVAGCLVLLDGRTFVGKVTSVNGGYNVDTPQGQMVYPYNYVKLTAASLDAAYQAQRDSLKNPTASELLDLARWCHKQKLFNEARQTCLDAIRVEPQRTELRQLLATIDNDLRKTQVTQVGGVIVDATHKADPVNGSPARTNSDFIRQIQPLLLNTCGNGACHSAKSKHEFRLQFVRTGVGGGRAQSQQNLEQTLKLITFESPETSPLLMVARRADRTPPHMNLFSARRGEVQYTLLRDWVLRAAAEQGGGTVAAAPVEATHKLRHPPVFSQKFQPASAVQEATSESPRRPAPVVQAGWDEIPREVSDEELSEAVHRSLAPDPFDPDEFNRAVHGDVPPRRSVPMRSSDPAQDLSAPANSSPQTQPSTSNGPEF